MVHFEESKNMPHKEYKLQYGISLPKVLDLKNQPKVIVAISMENAVDVESIVRGDDPCPPIESKSLSDEIKSNTKKLKKGSSFSKDKKSKQEDRLQAGSKLRALLKDLSSNGYDVTVLIADGLQKWNYNATKSQKMGDRFIAENADILKDYNYIRWEDFISKRKDTYEEMKKLIEKSSEPDALGKPSDLYKYMEKTFRHNIHATKTSLPEGAQAKLLQKSIELQKEEYAVILSMTEFKYLIYPKLSDAMAYVCTPGRFAGVTTPKFNKVHISPIQPLLAPLSMFAKPEKPLSYASKMALSTFEQYISSTEFSEDEKDSVSNQAINTILLRGMSKTQMKEFLENLAKLLTISKDENLKPLVDAVKTALEHDIATPPQSPAVAETGSPGCISPLRASA